MSKQSNQEKIKRSLYANQITETGKYLYSLRTNKRLSLDELVNQLASERITGARVEISKTQYMRYESGECFMNSETLIALCKFYGVSADYILFGLSTSKNSITNFLNKSNATQICDLLEYITRSIRYELDID